MFVVIFVSAFSIALIIAVAIICLINHNHLLTRLESTQARSCGLQCILVQLSYIAIILPVFVSIDKGVYIALNEKRMSSNGEVELIRFGV